MIYYRENFIKSVDGTIIPFRYIESMKETIDEDQTIEKLVDKKFLEICTTGGSRYRISVKDQFEENTSSVMMYTIDDYFQALFNRWMEFVE